MEKENYNHKSLWLNFAGSTKRSFRVYLFLFFLAVTSLTVCSTPRIKPLVIKEQGSFAVGGTTITNLGTFNPYNPTPEGQTFHGDHAYVFYQIPVKARKYPLVM